MESPFSWTLAEHVIDATIQKHEKQRAEDAEDGDFRCGHSLAMQIGNALRAAELLPPYKAPDQSGLQVHPAPDTIT